MHIDIADTYRYQARYPEAIDHYFNALEIFDQIEDNLGKAIAYNSIGVAFYEQKDYEKALYYYTETLKLELALGEEGSPANSYNNIALIHERENRLDSAMYYYQKSLAAAEETQNNHVLAWANNGMAIVYQKKQDYRQAFEYVQQAIVLREAMDRKELLAQSYNTLGQNYLALGQYTEALAIYSKSQLLCKEVDNPLNLKDALEGISLSYEGLNQAAKAYPYHKRFKAVSDSLASEENKKALIARTMQYEFDEQQALIKAESEKKELLYQQQIKEQWYYTYAFIGGFLGLLTIVVITLRGRQKQKQTNQLLAEQNQAINQQKEQLQELDRMKSLFFTNISHELRTPLTIISGMAEQIEGQLKVKRLIKRSSHNLLNLINQILDLRKLETGTVQLQLSQGDVIEYLQYIQASHEAIAGLKGVQLHFIPNERALFMDFDQEKLLQIVSNLLSNAIKFTPEGGHVRLIVDKDVIEQHGKPDQEALLLRISDTGIGIPLEQQTRIFDRFYQVMDFSATKGQDNRHPGPYLKPGNGGYGIGLALTKDLITLMDGRITFDSIPNEGTTFTVLLPISREAAKVDLEPETLKPLQRQALHQLETAEEMEPMITNFSSAKTTTGLSLLIIEDSRDIQHYLISLLEQKYTLYLASDGEEGLDMAFEHLPDLIISDVMMPGKDGFEVCHLLKNDDRTSHIPIVLLTAKASVDSRIEGLSRGADAYLAKPFNENELLIRLEKLVELRRALQLRYHNVSEPVSMTDTIVTPKFEKEDLFMAKLRVLIEDHLDDTKFGPSQLCKAMAMSRSQLHLKLKALTNRSTSIFIRTIRLHRAKELLQQGNLNVTQVAFQVGFNDPAYFSKKFSEEFGVNPKKTSQA